MENGMYKRIIAPAIAVILLLSPVLASAQRQPTSTTTATRSNASLIALLTQLVQVLEQELQNLVAQRAGGGIGSKPVIPPVQISPNFSASPTSGQAPLSVSFWASGLTAVGGYSVAFGDDAIGQIIMDDNSSCYYGATCSLNGYASHTYQSAGTYTATLINNLVQQSATPPVLDGITIDVSATTSIAAKSLTGTATVAAR